MNLNINKLQSSKNCEEYLSHGLKATRAQCFHPPDTSLKKLFTARAMQYRYLLNSQVEARCAIKIDSKSGAAAEDKLS